LRARRQLIAAAVIGALVGVTLMWWSIIGEPLNYGTGVGEQRLISLTDGSTVTLNARSRLRVAFTADSRTVELLEGQAFFHVAKNAVRPFVVLSSDTAVRAVGTQFDVNRSNGGTTVTVLEGRVAVYPEQLDGKRGRGDAPSRSVAVPPTPGDGARSVMLTAGERVHVVDGGAPVQPVHVDAVSATAWREGKIVLESATLSEVAAEFNRFNVRQVTAEDHGPTPLRLSGIFATDSEFLIEYLRERPDITVSETDQTVHVVRESRQ
jgi:transmembrane sensor